MDDSPHQTLAEMARLLAEACERRRTTPRYADDPPLNPEQPERPCDLIDVPVFALMVLEPREDRRDAGGGDS